jgi:hypothetical protein
MRSYRLGSILFFAFFLGQAAVSPLMAQGKRVKEGGFTGSGGGAVTTPETGAGGGTVVASGLPACDVMPSGTDDYACECPAGFSLGTVWGSDPYTADSDICTAAQHKGLIGPDGGLVRLIRGSGRDGYPGSTANGVQSQSWGSYESTIFLFPGKPAEVVTGGGQSQGSGAVDLAGLPECGFFDSGEYELSCRCEAGFQQGSLWGSGPYTGDSDICTAALHAGIIGTGGGGVLVTYARGMQNYPASTAHGITSDSWGQYNRSMRLYPAGSGGADGLPECGILGNGMEELTCICPAGFVPFDIWGSGPYTADSDICAAAQHAGLIGSQGGTVRAQLAPGESAYPASLSNGIRSIEWGSYHSSVNVYLVSGDAPVAGGGGLDLGSLPVCDTLPSGIDELTCACGAGFTHFAIWGSGPYTADSDICTAAQHAGVITAQGGAVRVVRAPGQSEYPASRVNGVDASSWGSYHSSINLFAAGGSVSVGPSVTVGTNVDIGSLPTCSTIPDGVDDYQCRCESGFRDMMIWGSGPYTADSDICSAAQHAGVIGAGGGGVRVVRAPGRDHYDASTQNGIESDSWGSYHASIHILPIGGGAVDIAALDALPNCDDRPEEAERFECQCTGVDDFGGVWGSDPYSADSDTCRAARHAGVIGPEGGDVTVLRLQGLSSYRASIQNGIESSSWSSYSASITFDRN